MTAELIFKISVALIGGAIILVLFFIGLKAELELNRKKREAFESMFRLHQKIEELHERVVKK